MPRIYNSANEALDFCKRCFPKSEPDAFIAFGGKEDGPDGRGDCFGYDCEHPDYDGCEYDCELCGKPLTSLDN